MATFIRFIKDSNQLHILEQFIHPKYRELGLSKLATIVILKTYPNTKSFVANLVEVNAASFFTTLLDRQQSETSQREKTSQFLNDSEYEAKIKAWFIAKFFNPKTPAELNHLRKEIIQIYLRHTPSGRVRSSLGFKDIEEIKINFNSKDSDYWVEVIVNKGDMTTKNTTDISVEYKDMTETKSITL